MSGFDNDVVYAKNADFTQADNQNVSEANGLATNGQLWIGSTALNAGGTHINVGTLTSPDGSIAIGYSSPNVTLQTNPAFDLHAPRFIVSNTDLTHGANYSTISSAITAAVALGGHQTVYIQSGTYTEDIFLKNGINLAALDYLGGSDGGTTILGKLMDNGVVVNATLTNLSLRTNSDYILDLINASSTVVLSGCYIDASNNTAINAGVGTNVFLYNCLGDLTTTGISFWTGAGSIQVYNSTFTNSGLSLAASTLSGSLNFENSMINSTLATSGIGLISMNNSVVSTSEINIVGVTTAGTNYAKIHNSRISTGTASSLSVGTGTFVDLYNTIIDSSNVDAITGAGTLNYSGVVFSNSSSTINVTTQNPKALTVFQGGTGLTSTTANQILYSSATNVIAGLPVVSSGVLVTDASGVPSINATVTAWTPTISFGGASVGITYSAQQGGYYQLGKVFFFDFYVNLSNKGTSTGTVLISGLPAISPATTSIFALSADSLTYTGQVNGRIPSGTSDISLDMWTSGGSRTDLADTAFANTTYIQMSGQVLLP
jgi:hypothetical protein